MTDDPFSYPDVSRSQSLSKPMRSSVNGRLQWSGSLVLSERDSTIRIPSRVTEDSSTHSLTEWAGLTLVTDAESENLSLPPPLRLTYMTTTSCQQNLLHCLSFPSLNYNFQSSFFILTFGLSSPHLFLSRTCQASI